jgi:hypothetical protein
MDEQVHNDDISFDLLVDGELSDAERRRLLASLDARADGWRRCALAFLEAQSWKGDLRDVICETPRIPKTNIETTSSLPRGYPWQRGLGWLAIAASLVVAFSLGTMRRERGQSIVAVPPAADNQIAAMSPTDDALTLWVRDNQGRKQPLRVPLVDAGTLDRELGVTFQSAMPAATRERLQQRGFDVQSKRRYAPLWLENGRPMIVPVEDTKIVPVSQPVY